MRRYIRVPISERVPDVQFEFLARVRAPLLRGQRKGGGGSVSMTPQIEADNTK